MDKNLLSDVVADTMFAAGGILILVSIVIIVWRFLPA